MSQRIMFAALAVATVGFFGDAIQARTDAPSEPLRVVVHVNFDDRARQAAGLKNIGNILKEAPGTTLVVVCHGGGISLAVGSDEALAERVKALIGRGARFVACENTMRERSIGQGDLVPGVGTVPSGAVEVIRRQRDGYGYFKP